MSYYIERRDYLDTDNWQNAKKEIRKLGIRITTSLKSCRLGCAGCALDTLPDDKPMIWQTSPRWSSDFGGYLNHQHIADTDLALKVVLILVRNKIPFDWNGSSSYSIGINYQPTN